MSMPQPGNEAREVGIEALLEDRLTRVMKAVLLGSLVTIAALLCLNIVAEGGMSPASWWIMAAAPFVVMLLFILKRSNARVTAVSLLVLMSALCIGIVLARGTIRGPVASMLILAAVLPALVMSRRSILVALVCGAAIFGALGLAESGGLLRPPAPVSLFTYWFMTVALAGFAAVIITFGRGIAEDALIRARKEMTERNQLQHRLMESNELFTNLSDQIRGVIFQWRLYPNGRSCVPYVSKGIGEIYELAPDEVRENAAPAIKRTHPEDIEGFLSSMRQSASSMLPWRHEFRVALPKQGMRWRLGDALPMKLEDGSIIWHGFISDITERKRSEERINTLAFFDQLTGLPNRTLLLDRLKQTLAASSRTGNFGALLFIDLDHFKALNDAKGHDMGDLLLKQVAARLRQSVRDDDTAARLGGDEFVVVLSGLGNDEKEAASAAETVAEKILAALNQVYQIGDVAHHGTASIGTTLFRGQLTPADELMKQADLAMYLAKEAGRNVVRFFDPAMEAAVKARAELEGDLRRAIDENQFLLYYQAQVLGDGRVTGAEALVRWNHPRRGIVSPAEFIPVAEATSLILPLGRWVLETACAQLAAWAGRPDMDHLTIAVNVSALQFRQCDFVDQVLSVVTAAGANPHRLKLELTESLLVDNVEQVIEKMHALKTEGIGFALDDFGTGYSSLSYLQRLPLDQLKIDQSFVRDVLGNPNDAAIARTIVALAQSLDLTVIAEGVETQAQCDFLASSNCHAYQGYFFSRPMPVQGFEQFARRA